MKKFTKKFINKRLKNQEMTYENIKFNARNTYKVLKIPQKLYIEISNTFPYSNLIKDLKTGNVSTSFMAGFIVGWAEKNKSIR